MKDNITLYKEVESNKASLVFSMKDYVIYAASCPTFGEEYNAMMIVEEKATGNKYRYDLCTGKQILIEEEYSPIPIKVLRTIEKALNVNYNVAANMSGDHNLFDAMLIMIDTMNQNTEGWKKVYGQDKYSAIPKFSNRRKSTTKKVEE